MMGRLNHDQRQLFYSFSLEEAVPDDHLVRKVAAVLDLSWIHAELAPHYPKNGRPSIDPKLMISMLIIGYLFAIRSEPLRSLSRTKPENTLSPYAALERLMKGNARYVEVMAGASPNAANLERYTP